MTNKHLNQLNQINNKIQNNQNQQNNQQNKLIYDITTLFFKIFTNESLRSEIVRHLYSERSVFSKHVSHRPLVYMRYSQINSAEWICSNGYYGLLLDKMKTRSALVFTSKATEVLCGTCRDIEVFHTVFNAKREYFCHPSLIERACETGNLDVVRYLLDTNYWNLNLACMELAVRNGHLETVQFIHQTNSTFGISGSFQLLMSSPTTPSSFSSSSSSSNQSTSPRYSMEYKSPPISPFLQSSQQSPPMSPATVALYKQAVSIPHIFILALERGAIKVAQYLFEKVGFFLSGPIEGMFKNLCMCGDFAFFKRIYESFQLVLATSSMREYHKFLIAMLDFTEHPMTAEHFKIIEYVERDTRVAIPPIKPTMSPSQLYSLYIRWAYLNKQRVINDMSNLILKSAIHLDDTELFIFAHKSFHNPHLSKHLPFACSRGALGIVHYLLDNGIETLTTRVIQIAHFGGHTKIVSYFRDNLNQLPVDTSNHYRKPVDCPRARYPTDVLDARANSGVCADPILALISSPDLLTSTELQTIFARAFTDGDHCAIRMLLAGPLIETISVTKSMWQTVAKIGDADLFEALLGIHMRATAAKKGAIINNSAEQSARAIASKVSVDACIWGHLDLLKHIINKHRIDMDAQNVEYMANSATFNGNCNIISYLLSNYKISKKALTNLMKHAINYRHYDLVKLYHHTYLVPIEKKEKLLIKHSATSCNIDSLKSTKKKITNNNNLNHNSL